jgi:steroid 5-alpha reductase family enzyme
MLLHNPGTDAANMNEFLATLSITLTAICTLMLLAWFVSLKRRDASIVDPLWGLGFVTVAWLSVKLHTPVSLRAWLLLAMTTIWGLRLSLFLWWRNSGKPEDYRYATMRAKYGDRFAWISLFTVFLLQAVLLWVVSLPVQAGIAARDPQPWGWFDAVGVALWSVGLFFEATSDWQLARFRSSPENRGHVMDQGLWRYTRHPNYFGDFCVWWGLYLVAVAAGAWWTVLSPIVMSGLLIKVSGVSLLEHTITERRPDYAAYKARTNAFFPWLPKSRC